MNEARPYASLSSGLLARKGAAKPAMRPQGFGNFGAGLEDLGWNDMGQMAPAPQDEFVEELPEHVPSSIAALTPSPRPARAEAEPEPAPQPAEPAPEPAVIGQQRSIAANLGAEAEEEAPEPAPRKEKAPVVNLPARPSAAAKGRKAAFTLRLDPDRHLRLRLACAVDGRSAQQIVTVALDEWLQTLPELETLARRAAGGKRS